MIWLLERALILYPDIEVLSPVSRHTEAFVLGSFLCHGSRVTIGEHVFLQSI